VEIDAFVLEAAGAPFHPETIRLDPPRDGEVLVAVTAVGVCHSDAAIRSGRIPHRFPAVVGHEAAGRVVEAGAGTDLAPGTRVLVGWIPQCGSCDRCLRGLAHLCRASTTALRGYQLDGTVRRTRADGSDLYAMGSVGAFATHAVVPVAGIVALPDDLPDEIAALIGCAVLTGVGAAVNAAGIRPGDPVVVIGAGGVGLNAVQGARLAGAGPIGVIDPNPDRRRLALELGASEATDPTADLSAWVTRLTGDRGSPVVIESAGRPDTGRMAFDLTSPGGTTVLVGLPGSDVELRLPVFSLVSSGRRVVGSWFGDADLARDVPLVIEWWRQGRLRLDPLVSSTGPLSDLPAAVARLEAGEGVRTVLLPQAGP
jgi:Zn-dependent alcohol dehydrogenase